MPIDFEVTMNEYLPLRDVVFNTLRRAILRGELKPGERLKAYLKKNNLKQKQFIIGLIEDALEEDEAEVTAEQPETEEPDEPDTDAEEE